MSNFLNPKLSAIWHGGDYNPEQWPASVWDEDIALMQESSFKVATIGVFSWAKLEPHEGEFDFSWLDEVIEKLSAEDRYFILATPSAAAPAWMTQKYPEILRTGSDRVRRLHGNRVNYNLCSPVYRQKSALIARKLAERYGDHPRLLAWHLSNEYGGEDFSPETISAFRDWLKAKYGTIEALNAAYWTTFWSHCYSDWDQLDAPGGPHGEVSIQGLTVDWRRFITDATVDFMLNEAAPLREFSPDIPHTTNLMGTFPGLDYRKFTAHLDFASWDSYPGFGGSLDQTSVWISVAFKHDLTRGLSKNGKWMLMECTPNSSNWYETMSVKRPGVHKFEALQAVAHGADGVQYFQWRQSRGSQEQFHGGVVNHGTTNNGRIFGEVKQAGAALDALSNIASTAKRAEVAIIYDWSSRWALDAAVGPVLRDKGYEQTCIDHYRAFWEAGVSVDVIGTDSPLEGYKLVVAPMLYSLSESTSTNLSEYVLAGGTLVSTYLTAWTDENSLVFESGYLGPLRKVFGVWSEEIDALPVGQQVSICTGFDSKAERYSAVDFCELIHPTTSKAIAWYDDEFYAGRPAATVNNYGNGRAYYVGSRNDQRFTNQLMTSIMDDLGIEHLAGELPEGITRQVRYGDAVEYHFYLNATSLSREVETVGWGTVRLQPWQVEILERKISARDEEPVLLAATEG